MDEAAVDAVEAVAGDAVEAAAGDAVEAAAGAAEAGADAPSSLACALDRRTLRLTLQAG